MTEPTSGALTRLVQQHVGEGKPMRIREFAERAVDPHTGASFSKSTVGNIVAGRPMKISPALVRAIAAGLGVPLHVVQVAAAEQFIGYRSNPGPGQPGA